MLGHRIREANRKAWRRARLWKPASWRYYRKTTKCCSCFMCGNPRRQFRGTEEELTMQEKRANISFEEQVA